jgi:hypothetical protein
MRSEQVVLMADIGFWEGIRDVASGRGQLRLILQPAMAIVLGIRLGIADAKEGQDPFLLRVVLTGEHRATIAKQALKYVIVPFALAIVIDSILQYLMLGHVRLLAAIVVGILLIGLPFSISRSLAGRIYRRSHPRLEHEPVR